MDIVKIQFLDEDSRWQTAECVFEGPTLRLGYNQYSALFRAYNLLEVTMVMAMSSWAKCAEAMLDQPSAMSALG